MSANVPSLKTWKGDPKKVPIQTRIMMIKIIRTITVNWMIKMTGAIEKIIVIIKE